MTMAHVTWSRRKEIKKHGKVAPTYACEVKETQNHFKQPPRFQDDYTRVLMTDHAHTNYWFKLCRDWYEDKDKPEDEAIWIRGEQTPIQWKSAIGNADMKTGFNTDWDIPIYRGDMLIRRSDNKIYMLDWNVQEYPIAQNSQTIECNHYFEFYREMPELTDENGYLIQEKGPQIVIPKIPGVVAEYTGRPDFEVVQSTPGITAVDLLTCYVQWNPITKKMRLNDTFRFGQFTYRVENISIERVEITKTHGEIMFHARRVTGGEVHDGEY